MTLSNFKKPLISNKNASILAFIIVIIFAVTSVLSINESVFKATFSDLYTVILELSVALILFYTAKVSARYGRRTQIAWGLLATSVLVYAIGDITWSIIELGLHQNPFPSAADIFYMSFYPLFALGIYYLPRISFNRSQELKIIIEMGIVIITFALIYWTFLIIPTLTNAENFLASAVSVAYIIADLVLLFVLVRLLYFEVGRVYHAPVIFLSLAIIFQIVTDNIYSLQSLQGTYVSGGLLDTGWIISFVFIGLAGFLQTRTEQYELPNFNLRAWLQKSNLTFYFTFILILIAFTLLIWGDQNLSTVNFQVIELGVGFILIMLFIRLVISLKENENLYLAAQNEINNRKKAENQLKESEAYYRTIFTKSGAPSVIIENDKTISLANPEFEKLSGYSVDELEGKKKWTEFVLEDDLERMKSYHRQRRINQVDTPDNYEFHFINRQGEVKNVILFVALIPGTKKSVASLLDITERKNAEKATKASLKEKMVLLREIHHRVKNNMQIISGLLTLQIKHVEEEEAENVLQESQGRVKSMAMIHENLYRSHDLSKINFKEYVESLINDIFYSYGIKTGTIGPELEIEDIRIDIDTAIPLGLIINELVTNSVKYAFPKSEGTIKIKLKSSQNQLELTIADNGVGLPDELDYKNTNSLGLQLVNGLVGQINGKIEIEKSHGTQFKITFEKLEYNERI